MEIRRCRNINDLKILYKINSSKCGEVYKTANGYVIKKLNNDTEYNIISELHNGDFLSYLQELDEINSSLTVPFETIYVGRDNRVNEYTYMYQLGKSIDRLAPKTCIDSLIKTLKSFKEKIHELDNIELKNITGKDIIYTKDKNDNKILKIVGLDYSTFSDKDMYKNNLCLLSNAFLSGLFSEDISYVDDSVKKLVDSVQNGEMFIDEFLEEYKYISNQKFGRCDYVKHLSKGLIR